MKNSTAHPVENAVLKKVDHVEVLDIVYASPQAYLISSTLPLARLSNQLIKRTADLLISSILLLLVFSWLLPIVALLIKLDSRGPVFFLQKRNKKGGSLFTCIKFRTMVVNEEADSLPAYESDHRITRLGKILRRFHIDELPQLLNVWWGDMSLIGPRPYMVTDNEKYEARIEHYPQRHLVKPGITGLAQSRGHFGVLLSTTEMQQRVDLDLEYIRDWSMAMDLKIMLRTLRMMFR